MPETKRHAWSDNDLVGQKKTQQDLSENVYELELSASCQNLSNNIHSTKQSKKGNNICLISGISKKNSSLSRLSLMDLLGCGYGYVVAVKAKYFSRVQFWKRSFKKLSGKYWLKLILTFKVIVRG